MYVNLLNSYGDCFANSLDEFGCTYLEQMSINLNDDVPVVYRSYRLTQKELEEVKILVNDLCENGTVRESNSPYASPIIVLRKKTGDRRIFLNYPALNRKTVTQHYPLLSIESNEST